MKILMPNISVETAVNAVSLYRVLNRIKKFNFNNDVDGVFLESDEYHSLFGVQSKMQETLNSLPPMTVYLDAVCVTSVRLKIKLCPRSPQQGFVSAVLCFESTGNIHELLKDFSESNTLLNLNMKTTNPSEVKFNNLLLNYINLLNSKVNEVYSLSREVVYDGLYMKETFDKENNFIFIYGDPGNKKFRLYVHDTGKIQDLMDSEEETKPDTSSLDYVFDQIRKTEIDPMSDVRESVGLTRTYDTMRQVEVHKPLLSKNDFNLLDLNHRLAQYYETLLNKLNQVKELKYNPNTGTVFLIQEEKMVKDTFKGWSNERLVDNLPELIYKGKCKTGFTFKIPFYLFKINGFNVMDYDFRYFNRANNIIKRQYVALSVDYAEFDDSIGDNLKGFENLINILLTLLSDFVDMCKHQMKVENMSEWTPPKLSENVESPEVILQRTLNDLGSKVEELEMSNGELTKEVGDLREEINNLKQQGVKGLVQTDKSEKSLSDASRLDLRTSVADGYLKTHTEMLEAIKYVLVAGGFMNDPNDR
jgi:hypothetical protein